MKTTRLEYRPDQQAHIASQLEMIEYLPVKMAVVDYLGGRDADGLVTTTTELSRHVAIYDLRHVAIYDLTVVCLNRTARNHQDQEHPLAQPYQPDPIPATA